MGRSPKSTFSREDVWMANRHMKKCSTLLIIQEMQIKTTRRYQRTLATMAIICKSRNNKCWRKCEEKGTLFQCWEYKLVQPLWKTVRRFLRKLNIELPYDPEIALWGIYPDKTFIEKRYMCPYIHCSTIHNSQDMETTQMFIDR